MFKWNQLPDWLTINIELGYPGCEYQIREALAEVLGENKSNFFFDKVGQILYHLQALW